MAAGAATSSSSSLLPSTACGCCCCWAAALALPAGRTQAQAREAGGDGNLTKTGGARVFEQDKRMFRAGAGWVAGAA